MGGGNKGGGNVGKAGREGCYSPPIDLYRRQVRNNSHVTIYIHIILHTYILDAVGSSRILIGKQKLGLTFNSDKLGGTDFTKFSKLTMCSA